jgi:hypothetical protein
VRAVEDMGLWKEIAMKEMTGFRWWVVTKY